MKNIVCYHNLFQSLRYYALAESTDIWYLSTGSILYEVTLDPLAKEVIIIFFS